MRGTPLPVLWSEAEAVRDGIFPWERKKPPKLPEEKREEQPVDPD